MTTHTRWLANWSRYRLLVSRSLGFCRSWVRHAVYPNRSSATMAQSLPARPCSSGAKKSRPNSPLSNPANRRRMHSSKCLNGKFRNECLNQHWFRTLNEAREEIDRWRQHYNHVRPDSSLDYRPPLPMRLGWHNMNFLYFSVVLSRGKGQKIVESKNLFEKS